jgi:UDP-glucose 6-dehydrogenase
LGFVEEDLYSALNNADAMVLMTAHQEFRNINFQQVKKIMKTPIIVDGRRIYNPEAVRGLGFHYYGIGAKNKN